MPATDGPSAGQMTEQTLSKTEQAVAEMEATLQKVAEEMARSRLLVDRIKQDRGPSSA